MRAAVAKPTERLMGALMLTAFPNNEMSARTARLP